jgi:hypothetical protein
LEVKTMLKQAGYKDDQIRDVFGSLLSVNRLALKQAGDSVRKEIVASMTR